MMFLWGLRFFVFKLHESPKYLMGRGRDQQAVETVHFVAAQNSKTSNLSVDELRAVDTRFGTQIETSAAAAAKRKLAAFNLNHVKALFATRKLAYSTTLLIIIWGKCTRLRSPHRLKRRYSTHRPGVPTLVCPILSVSDQLLILHKATVCLRILRCI